ncbi:response regulator transcription factor [Kitasatospora sp. NPDC087861]|uniref:helix-turn-helix transcriptional regulator n=1 Tax=Kitasatospora sp. NPDC087861 TaxID=3364070 RepID=UPI00381BF62C
MTDNLGVPGPEEPAPSTRGGGCAALPPGPGGPNGNDAVDWQVYDHVRAHGRLDPDDLARALGIDPQAARSALARLAERHLVLFDPADPQQGRALSPRTALTGLAAEVEARIAAETAAHQQRLAALREDIQRFTRLTHPGVPDAAPDAVTVLPDITAVNALLEEEAARCRYEVIACQPGDVSRNPANLEPALARDRALLERGIRMRSLQQHSVRFHGPTQVYVAAATALGGEYRTAHELFGRLIVFDDTVAFLPTDSTTWGAVVVREPHLIAYLRGIFEQTWTHATVFQDPTALGAEGLGQAARDIDATLLRLLASGLKDETIARRLGLSLRTVRRRVADILERLGAESRFQAAVIATRTGLLDRPDDADPAELPEDGEASDR